MQIYNNLPFKALLSLLSEAAWNVTMTKIRHAFHPFLVEAKPLGRG